MRASLGRRLLQRGPRNDFAPSAGRQKIAWSPQLRSSVLDLPSASISDVSPATQLRRSSERQLSRASLRADIVNYNREHRASFAPDFHLAPSIPAQGIDLSSPPAHSTGGDYQH